MNNLVMASTPVCRSCGQRRGGSPGEICRPCYDDPVIRRAFPKEPTGGLGGHLNTEVIASTPTMTRPGSGEKIAIMTERAKNGESVFHPQDLTVEMIDGV